MKRFKEFLEEDGAAAGVGGAGVSTGPTNNSAGITTGEPGVKLPRKKKSPIMFKLPIARKGYNG